jgi:hypothetical protein
MSNQTITPKTAFKDWLTSHSHSGLTANSNEPLVFNGGSTLLQKLAIVDNHEINDAMNYAKARAHHYLNLGWHTIFSKTS